MEQNARDEVASILGRIGDDAPSVCLTGMSGILTVSTSVEPSKFVGAVAGMVTDEPWSVRYILRAIPIDKTVPTDAERVADACSAYSDTIGDDTYRISVEKRHSKIQTLDIIAEVASRIHGRVMLENPAWIILVQVIGSRTGVSLVRPGDIVSVEKLKRSL